LNCCTTFFGAVPACPHLLDLVAIADEILIEGVGPAHLGADRLRRAGAGRA